MDRPEDRAAVATRIETDKEALEQYKASLHAQHSGIEDAEIHALPFVGWLVTEAGEEEPLALVDGQGYVWTRYKG